MGRAVNLTYPWGMITEADKTRRPGGNEQLELWYRQAWKTCRRDEVLPSEVLLATERFLERYFRLSRKKRYFEASDTAVRQTIWRACIGLICCDREQDPSSSTYGAATKTLQVMWDILERRSKRQTIKGVRRKRTKPLEDRYSQFVGDRGTTVAQAREP